MRSGRSDIGHLAILARTADAVKFVIHVGHDVWVSGDLSDC